MELATVVASQAGLNCLGAGCYGRVYEYEHEGKPAVFKRGAKLDGTSDYIRWCYEQQQMGNRMYGMPEVYAYGEYAMEADGSIAWWCVMKRYVPFPHRFDADTEEKRRLVKLNYDFRSGVDRYDAGSGDKESMEARACKELRDSCGIQFNDLHSENVMYDPELDMVIATDPSSADSERQHNARQAAYRARREKEEAEQREAQAMAIAARAERVKEVRDAERSSAYERAKRKAIAHYKRDPRCGRMIRVAGSMPPFHLHANFAVQQMKIYEFNVVDLMAEEIQSWYKPPKQRKYADWMRKPLDNVVPR